MPARPRRRYTEEFNMEAVRLVCDSAHPMAQVARDLGIPDNVFYRWTAQHRQAEAHGIVASMSRLGNCWDNACAENFFGTRKCELIYHRHYRTRKDAKQNIFEYIATPSLHTQLPFHG